MEEIILGKSADDADMNDSEMVFDNFRILKELGNISNLVGNEDFLETVPKAKLSRVKWTPMFNCLKQSILDEMVKELCAMWEYEGMPQKLEALERQKEKFANSDTPAWRPQLGDVKAQLKAWDMVNLRKQKTSLEALAKDYEAKVNRLKKILPTKRSYLKILQMDIQKCQTRNEEFTRKIGEKFNTHSELVNSIITSPQIHVDNDDKWSMITEHKEKH